MSNNLEDKVLYVNMLNGGTVALVVSHIVAWRFQPAERSTGLGDHTVVFMVGDVSFRLVDDVGLMLAEYVERAL